MIVWHNREKIVKISHHAITRMQQRFKLEDYNDIRDTFHTLVDQGELLDPTEVEYPTPHSRITMLLNYVKDTDFVRYGNIIAIIRNNSEILSTVVTVLDAEIVKATMDMFKVRESRRDKRARAKKEAIKVRVYGDY